MIQKTLSKKWATEERTKRGPTREKNQVTSYLLPSHPSRLQLLWLLPLCTGDPHERQRAVGRRWGVKAGRQVNVTARCGQGGWDEQVRRMKCGKEEEEEVTGRCCFSHCRLSTELHTVQLLLHSDLVRLHGNVHERDAVRGNPLWRTAAGPSRRSFTALVSLDSIWWIQIKIAANINVQKMLTWTETYKRNAILIYSESWVLLNYVAMW